MKHSEFIESLKSAAPPKDLSGEELALWYAAKDDWEMAHNTAQEISTETASWIHAYLHRVEGDQPNAKYWYQRANREPSSINLDDEAEQIIMYILDMEKGVL